MAGQSSGQGDANYQTTYVHQSTLSQRQVDDGISDEELLALTAREFVDLFPAMASVSIRALHTLYRSLHCMKEVDETQEHTDSSLRGQYENEISDEELLTLTVQQIIDIYPPARMAMKLSFVEVYYGLKLAREQEELLVELEREHERLKMERYRLELAIDECLTQIQSIPLSLSPKDD